MEVITLLGTISFDARCLIHTYFHRYVFRYRISIKYVLRMTWLMAIIYPIIVILIIDEVKVYEYFTKPKYAFQLLGEKIMALTYSGYYYFSKWSCRCNYFRICHQVIKKTRISNVLNRTKCKKMCLSRLLLNTPFFDY